MGDKFTIVPLGIPIPYTAKDISVVIPQVQRQFKRLQWFLKQYVEKTDPQVVANTIVIYDEDDDASRIEIEKYNILAMSCNQDWSTVKLKLGFRNVTTRLCCRIYNDTVFRNEKWTDMLVDQFNTTYVPQLIGEVHPSGMISKEGFEKMVDFMWWYRPVFDRTEFTASFYDMPYASCTYINGYFMAAQTYVFDLYKTLFEDFHGGSMNVEDLMFSHVASSHNIQITRWVNQGEFLDCLKGIEGDKDTLDTDSVKNTNKDAVPKFERVTYE